MEITSIVKHRKNPSRYAVYVDNEYSFSINEEDYFREGLYEKKEITEEEIRRIREVVNFNSAKQDAVKFLALKMRCEKEVYAKLKQLGYGHSIIEKVVDEVRNLGYINDSLYVKKYIFDRSRLKPQTKKALKFNLLKKGVAEDVIDSVMEEWSEDEELVASRLLKRKFGKYDLADGKVALRAKRFLYGRGVSFEVIEKVIEDAIEEERNK